MNNARTYRMARSTSETSLLNNSHKNGDHPMSAALLVILAVLAACTLANLLWYYAFFFGQIWFLAPGKKRGTYSGPQIRQTTENRPTGSQSSVRIDYFYSKTPKPIAKVLYLSTVSGQEMAFDSCRHLSTLGLDLVCPTYRGFERKPNFFVQSRRKLQQDAQVAIEAALFFKPDLPLIIFGHSLGAYPAMFLSATQIDKVQATILLAPLPNSERVVDHHLRKLGPLRSIKKLAFFRFDIDTTFWATRSGVPTSLIYPTRDRLVPPRLQKDLLRSVPIGSRAQSYPIHGAGHLPLIGEKSTMIVLSKAVAESIK